MVFKQKFITSIQRLRCVFRTAYWARFAPHQTIVAEFPGKKSEKQERKLCLFATYDPSGLVDPYVKQYLAEIKQAGFDIVVVSTSSSIDSADVEYLLRVCRKVLHRKNVGLDFASWKAAMDSLDDWNSYDSLLLANDSVYGPFIPLKALIDEMDLCPDVLCGLTDSHEKGYHLQSYFLYWKKPLLTSPFFKEFWSQVGVLIDKDQLIKQYEIGLSAFLHKEGVRFRAIYPCESVMKRSGDRSLKVDLAQCNLTLHLWDVLLRDFRFPFIKTEILRKNRLNFDNISGWRRLVSAISPSWVQLIEGNLRRVAADAPGLRSL